MFASVPILVGGAILGVAASHWAYWLAWGGSFVLAVVLVVLLWSRWGQSKPLHKCAALSLIVHLILAFLTMTVRIVSGGGNGGGGGGNGLPIHVRIVEDKGKLTTLAAAAPSETKPEVTAPPLLTPPPPPPKQEEKELAKKVEEPTTSPKEPAPKVVEAPLKSPKETKTEPKPVADLAAIAAAAIVVKVAEKPPATPAPVSSSPASAPSVPVVPANPTSLAAPSQGITEVLASSATSIYALRNASGRPGLVAGQGGSHETEEAVSAALKWLAAAQARDGRWDALHYGAGREDLVLGQNRGGAGRGADTGVTALALLAFLGAGHSHVQGAFQDNVRRGLDFLLRSQAADGSLFGDASLYAQMYCHSMATFALAEAEAVTGDDRLRAAVVKAVNFSVAAQNTSTGGWRYRSGDTGDTSQLGWQLMALASAERAGIRVPDQTWNRVDRFLQSVRRGSSGGLASYRSDGPASTSMTAEAFYCRLILQEMTGTKIPEPAAEEATSQLVASVPTPNQVNLYYWYYATLALHHRQLANESAAAAWHTWNHAMIAALKQTQLTEGDAAGSWDTNTMWGGYGGRVYTTAMAAMCLEVYYRYTPAPPPVDPQTASRQSVPRAMR